ncbi:hypothetical protein BROUX41_003073 [Berkeleyomyces rouxiae]|uniref:uncharacterized protein n=1 Tax=Berkeleyomyces rouxiae TaxID=2035830 RepID=UPI003B7F1FA0
MFYSHESRVLYAIRSSDVLLIPHVVLTSTQYGVATIWLAATVNTKACMSRKSVSEVDIGCAVKKILDPGAPLALRLQSNLLFGVSRVYSQKCYYVLDDATRMIQRLRLASTLDAQDHLVNPSVVKAPRKQIVLEDNPAFLWESIPAPDFLSNKPLLQTSLPPSQGQTFRTSSQMSPASSTPSLQRKNGSRNSSIFLDLGKSPDRSSIILPFDLGGSPTRKPETIRIQGDDDLMPLEDLDLELDFGLETNQAPVTVPGGIDIGMFEDLPSHPNTNLAKENKDVPHDIDVLMLNDIPGLIPEEALLPEAEAFASMGNKDAKNQPLVEEDEKSKSTRMRCARTSNLGNLVDEETHLDMDSIRGMSHNYVEYQDNLALKKRRREATGNTKVNAMNCVFGHGIGRVGAMNAAAQHPLASTFAGATLAASIFDPSVFSRSKEKEGGRGSHIHAVLDDKVDMEIEPEDARQAAGRLSHDIETLSAQGEHSRRNTPGLDDKMGSSFAPWVRDGSAVPSSTKSARIAHSRLQSPLIGPALQDIEHLSSDAGHSMDFGLGDFGAMGNGDDVGPSALSGEVTHFREYMHDQVRYHLGGVSGSAVSLKYGGSGGSGSRKPVSNSMVWLDFSDFAGPGHVSRPEAARAFLNVLTLATRNECKIRTEYLPVMDERLLGTQIIEVGFDSSTMPII